MGSAKLKSELGRLFKELESKLVHRGYTTGFLLGTKADQNIVNSHNKSVWEFCGQVIKSEKADAGKIAVYFQVHNTIKLGDTVEIIRPNYDIIKVKLTNLWDAKTNTEIKEAHGGGGAQTAYLKLDKKFGLIPALTVIRRQN
jgi:hypothetical protein